MTLGQVPGECVVRLVEGRIVVERADPVVRFSRELVLLAHTGDARNVRLDDDEFVILADPEVRYRLHDDGDPHSLAGTLITPPAEVDR